MQRIKLRFAARDSEAPLCDKGDLIRDGMWVLCWDRLRRHIELPKTAKNIELVFTKLGNANSFELVRDVCGDARFAEINELLTGEFTLLATRALDAGCRHVHLEYEL